MNHDLTFVAVERRAEVLRRIEVIERFIDNPGRRAAEEAAVDLGIKAAQFYNLVRAWRINGRPEEIASGGTLRNRSPKMTELQIALVSEAIIANSRATASEIIDDVVKRAKCRGLDLPAQKALARYVRRARPALLSPNAQDADLIIDHTVVELPVHFSSLPERALLTVVIEVAENAIVGMALAQGLPRSSVTAAALLDAISHSLRRQDTATADPLRVRIVSKLCLETDYIAPLLSNAVFRLQVESVGAHGGGQYVETLLGARSAGIQLRPRLAWNASRRAMPAIASSKAFSPQEATDLVRGRLAPPRPSLCLGRLGEAHRAGLMAGLLAIVHDPDDTL